MRRHIIRSGIALPGSTTALDLSADENRLRCAKESIEREAGPFGSKLVALIGRRAPNAEAHDTAEFILRMWRDGGTNRARIVAHAMRTTEDERFEEAISNDVRVALQPLAGDGFSVERSRDIQRALVRMLRAKMPSTPVDRLRTVASSAIEFRADRISVKLDPIVALLRPPAAVH